MDISPSLEQVKILIKRGQKREARSLLRQIVKNEPNSPDVYILFAQVAEKREHAIYCLEQALRINPEHQYALEELERSQWGELFPIRSPMSKIQKKRRPITFLRGLDKKKITLWAILIVIILCMCPGLPYAFEVQEWYEEKRIDLPIEAFSFAAGFASKELVTYESDPLLNPGCEHKPKWYRDEVNEVNEDELFLVRGRVVTANVYCVIDESQFSLSVSYSKGFWRSPFTYQTGRWTLDGSIEFSNPCVLDRYLKSAQTETGYLRCHSSQWEGP